jgi:hypothetical protein
MMRYHRTHRPADRQHACSGRSFCACFKSKGWLSRELAGMRTPSWHNTWRRCSHSLLTGTQTEGRASRSCYLGRSWKPTARVVFRPGQPPHLCPCAGCGGPVRQGVVFPDVRKSECTVSEAIRLRSYEVRRTRLYTGSWQTVWPLGAHSASDTTPSAVWS